MSQHVPGGPITDQTMAEIAAEMVGDGVWIDPALAVAEEITPAQEQRLEAAVAATQQSDRPVRVVLVDVPAGPPFNLSPTQFVEVLLDDLTAAHPGRDHGALYLVGDNSLALSVESHLDQRGFDDYLASYIAKEEHPDDFGAQAVAAVDLLRLDRDAFAARVSSYQATQDERRDERIAADDDTAGTFWMASALVLAGVVVLVGVRALWRRRSARRTGFQISPTVLESVLGAEDRALAERADDETLALGEALAAAQAPEPGARAAWAAALEHYQAARRVLEKRRTSADSLGALVLARLGESARQAALADRAWQAPQVCWINPGHRWGTRTAQVGTAQVLVCSDCAARPGTRREFTVPAGSGTRAWYDAELGIWTRTGYGTTSRDFPAEVLTAFGR